MKSGKTKRKLKIMILIMVFIIPIFEFESNLPVNALLRPPRCYVNCPVAAVFTESGLPSGTQWTIIFDGSSYTSSVATYTKNVIMKQPGTYSYTINIVNLNNGYYIPSPRNGSVTLSSNSDTYKAVSFSYHQNSLSGDSQFYQYSPAMCNSQAKTLYLRNSTQNGGVYLTTTYTYGMWCSNSYDSIPVTFGESGNFNITFTISYYGFFQSLTYHQPGFAFGFQLIYGSAPGIPGNTYTMIYESDRVIVDLDPSQQLALIQNTWSYTTTVSIPSGTQPCFFSLYFIYGTSAPYDIIDFYNNGYYIGNTMISWVYSGT